MLEKIKYPNINAKLKGMYGKTLSKEDFEDLLCVLTGKNNNQITLSSILRQRGFCAYWTSEILSVDDILNYVPHNSLIEIMEPYGGDEPMFHFVSSYDYPRGNIHAVISAQDITKE